jgi:molecular chaperone GrpE
MGIESLWEWVDDEELIKVLNHKIGMLRREIDTISHTYERKISHMKRAASEDLVKKLLPVFDDIWHAALQDDVFRMVWTKLEAALKEAGVVAFVPLGENFDPMLHQAVSGEGNTVVRVLRPGYMMGDFVLRPALVVLGKEVDTGAD